MSRASSACGGDGAPAALGSQRVSHMRAVRTRGSASRSLKIVTLMRALPRSLVESRTPASVTAILIRPEAPGEAAIAAAAASVGVSLACSKVL